MSKHKYPPRYYDCNYWTPLPVHEPLIPLAEMVRRIEYVRASLEPLPLGRRTVRPVLTRRSA